jgi:hypothetical protein
MTMKKKQRMPFMIYKEKIWEALKLLLNGAKSQVDTTQKILVDLLGIDIFIYK